MQHRRSDSSLGRNNTQGDGRRSPTEGSHSQGYDPIRHTASPDRQQQQPYYEYYPPQAVAHRAYYEGSPHSSNTQSEFELYETPRLSRSSPFRQLILESAKRIVTGRGNPGSGSAEEGGTSQETSQRPSFDQASHDSTSQDHPPGLTHYPHCGANLSERR